MTALTTRAERVAEAQRLRAEGLLLREIAERMGSKVSTVHAWITDPDLSKQRARFASYAGTCIDCGAPTTGHGGPGKARERCVACANAVNGAARKVWTREAIVRAIQAWADEFGEPPAVSDWQPNLARRLNDPARAQRFEERAGDFPVHVIVFREFGAWNTALRAAGFEPRAPHGGGGNGARRRSVRDRVAA